jgi:hypothetical protein
MIVCHERGRRGRCRRPFRMRCCTRDGGARPWAWWPSAVGLQGQAANRPELLRLRAVVVSVEGKGAPTARQVRITKASVSEPLMTCRKRSDDIKTGVELLLREEPGRGLLTGQVVSGMKVARAWSRLSCGTWEPVALRPRAAWGRWRKGDPQAAGTARGRVPKRGTGADRPVVAMKPGNAGGAKGAGRPGSLGGQPLGAGGAG